MDNIARVRESNGLFREGDMDGGMRLFAEDVVYVHPGRSTLSGVKHGREAVKAHITAVKSAGLSNTPRQWFELGDQVLTLTTIRVGGHEFTAVDVMTFKDGEVVYFESVTDTAALEDVYGIQGVAAPHVEHVAVNVADLDASVAWYRDMLGAVVVGEERTPSGFSIVTVAWAGLRFDLGSRTGMQAHPRAGATPADSTTLTGFSHVGVIVVDVPGTAAGLRARGVEFVSEPAPTDDGGTYAWFVDLDGNHFELIGR